MVHYPNPTVPSATQTTEYLIGLNNHPRGPFSLEDLALLARSGVIDPKTRVMAQGWDDWVPLGKVPELSSLLAVVSAAPPAGSNGQGGGAETAEAISRLASRMDQLQAGLLALAKDLEARTEALREGQKQAVAAVGQGQQGLHEAVAAFQAADASRKEALAAQLAEAELRLSRAVRDQIAAQDERLTAALNQVAALMQKEAEAAAAHRRQESEGLAREIGQILPAMQGLRVALDQSIEQAARLQGEARDQMASALARAMETSAAQERALLDAQAERLGERLGALEAAQRAQGQSQIDALKPLAESLQALQTETETKTKELTAHLEKWSGEMAVRIERAQSAQEAAQKAVLADFRSQTTEEREALASWLEELQETLAHLGQGQEAQKSRTDQFAAAQESLQKEFTTFAAATRQQSDAFLQHISGWEAQLRDKLRPVIEEIQSTPGRLDAQFSRLEEATAMVLNAHTAFKEQAVGDLVALRADLEKARAEAEARAREMEDNAHERHAILLAAADESRAGADRIIKHVQETFAAAREETSALRVEVEAIKPALEAQDAAQRTTLEKLAESIRKQIGQVDEAQRQAGEASARAAAEASRALAALQQSLGQLQSDHEQQAGMLARQMVGLSESLPEHFNQQAELLQERLKPLQKEMDAVAGSVQTLREENQAGREEGRKGMDEVRKELREVVGEATGRTAAAVEQAREDFQRAVQMLRDELRALGADQIRLAEVAAVQSRTAMERADQIAAAEEARQREAAAAAESRHAEIAQSLANIGAWSETLHDQIDAAQTALADGTAALRMALEHHTLKQFEALQSTLRQSAAAAETGQRALAEDLRVLAAEITKQIHFETSSVAEALGRRLDEAATEQRARALDEKSARDQVASLQAAGIADLKDGLSGLAAETRKRAEAEARARQADFADLQAALDKWRAGVESALSQNAAQADARWQEMTAAIARNHEQLAAQVEQARQDTGSALDKFQAMLREEIATGWAKRWTVLSSELASIRDSAGQSREELAQRLAQLQAQIPAAAAAQFKPAVDALEKRLGGLHQALEAQEKRLAEARAATEKEIALQFGMQQRLFDQIQATLNKQVAESMGRRIEEIQKEIERVRQQAPETREALAGTIRDSVAKLPEYLTESYRVTHNELQKQIAELALEINSAAQVVEKSRLQLDKAGAEHRALMEEAVENTRQLGAAAIRDARQEIEKFNQELLAQLQSWQAQQSRVIDLAASLIVESKGPPPPPELAAKAAPSTAGSAKASGEARTGAPGQSAKSESKEEAKKGDSTTQSTKS